MKINRNWVIAVMPNLLPFSMILGPDDKGKIGVAVALGLQLKLQCILCILDIQLYFSPKNIEKKFSPKKYDILQVYFWPDFWSLTVSSESHKSVIVACVLVR